MRRRESLVLILCFLAAFLTPGYEEMSVAQEDCSYLLCTYPPADPMPVPSGLSHPASWDFGIAFTADWVHVWTGCGGYEFEYSRDGTTWVVTDVASGSSVDIKIRRPDGPVNDPTSYELRVRAYWGGGCDEREYSEYSQSGNIEMYCGPGACDNPPGNPMPVPTGLTNPSISCFGAAFTASWDHVWSGCGGYEFEYCRAGTSTWIVTDVASGSSVDIKIRRPDGPVNDPTSYELRVRAYWGGGCDERVYSYYSQSGNIEMYCIWDESVVSKATWGAIKASYR